MVGSEPSIYRKHPAGRPTAPANVPITAGPGEHTAVPAERDHRDGWAGLAETGGLREYVRNHRRQTEAQQHQSGKGCCGRVQNERSAPYDLSCGGRNAHQMARSPPVGETVTTQPADRHGYGEAGVADRQSPAEVARELCRYTALQSFAAPSARNEAKAITDKAINAATSLNPPRADVHVRVGVRSDRAQKLRQQQFPTTSTTTLTATSCVRTDISPHAHPVPTAAPISPPTL